MLVAEATLQVKNFLSSCNNVSLLAANEAGQASSCDIYSRRRCHIHFWVSIRGVPWCWAASLHYFGIRGWSSVAKEKSIAQRHR